MKKKSFLLEICVFVFLTSTVLSNSFTSFFLFSTSSLSFFSLNVKPASKPIKSAEGYTEGIVMSWWLKSFYHVCFLQVRHKSYSYGMRMSIPGIATLTFNSVGEYATVSVPLLDPYMKWINRPPRNLHPSFEMFCCYQSTSSVWCFLTQTI